MKQFSDLGLAECLLRAVSAEGYTNPTPIQAEVIPAMLAERDVLGIAQTGTGKTASFVLPLLDKISRGQSIPLHKSCSTLILVPTRELAGQVADSIRTYGRFTRHSVAVVVGGARPGPQIRAVARGVNIIVATPGRLLDHVSTGAIRLDSTDTVVLDEADQMLDLGFMPAIRKIMAQLHAERQTVLLSATMPKQVRALAHDFLNDPAEISVAPASRPIERIDQKVMHVDGAAKRSILVDLLKADTVERAIVFTRTKRGADRVSDYLEKAGLSAAAIHGNKSQTQRDRTLKAFRAGRSTILVATDIAARGIDVDGVSHVINYELPNVPEAYVHRIGRTARAGKSGFAISLCDRGERGLLRDIERLIGSALAAELVTGDGEVSAAPAGFGRLDPKQKGRKPAPGKKAGGATRGMGPARGPAKPKREAERRPGPDRPDGGLARMLGAGDAKRKPLRGRGRGNAAPQRQRQAPSHA